MDLKAGNAARQSGIKQGIIKRIRNEKNKAFRCVAWNGNLVCPKGAEGFCNGSQDLKLSRDQVTVTVLEQPSKGFFGIGSKLAKVRVEEIIKEEPKAVKIEKAAEEKEWKHRREIERYLQRAIDRALRYKYYNIDELIDQLKDEFSSEVRFVDEFENREFKTKRV